MMWCTKCHNGTDKFVPHNVTEIKKEKNFKSYVADPCRMCGNDTYQEVSPFPPAPIGMGSGNQTGKTHQKRERKDFYEDNPFRPKRKKTS